MLAGFIVSANSGLAVSPEDFSFNSDVVVFSPGNLTFDTGTPVRVIKDNEAEMDEQFTISFEIISPLSFDSTVIINNPSATITILDSTSECEVI